MQNKRILLVEDEESVRDAIKFTLSSWYDVTGIDKTIKALEILEKEKIDLVLLDMFIRGEGEEGSLNALRTINEKYPKLPVIVLTGSVVWRHKWPELVELGAYGYISKPFDRDKIREIIERCLKGEKMKEICE